jgi:opacity protein-like surface antigen
VDLAYHGWSGSDDYNTAWDAFNSTTGSETSWTGLQATGCAILAMQTEGSIDPWFKAGAGVYNIALKLESPVLNDDDSESKFGFNLGVGFDYRNSPSFGVGVDAAWHMISAEDDLGSDISMFTAGVHWTWSSAK